ncbi:hypothetical protein O4H53_05305 [Sulfitobacter sp. G21635-S1]|uniref:hypothetical protein n=1 Tax=Sulfitobacter sp. G21635-S1 TaxID=3014043 RepID=UPI000DF4167D|nr:hypothetical protein [Sulfitobacter sp. G21635-S1]MCZ4254945.1 hypothetical protein [Sulfitobacter sp. G21635-S1]
MIRTTAIIATALTLGLGAAPALAGDAAWTYSDGMKLKIKCRSSGCKVTAKKPGGSWVLVEEGKGGNENFQVLEAKYKKVKPAY